MLNIALICGENYESNIWQCNNGWHHYGFWKKALEEHSDINIACWYPWSHWRQMPTTGNGIDLYFFLDFRYDLWKLNDFDFHPRILYWWDAFHHMFSLVAQIPLVFDKVYNAEYIDTEHLNMCGFKNVEWLPGAFYPGLYRPLDLPKIHDFGFVGQQDDNVIRKSLTRKRQLDILAKSFKGIATKDVIGPPVNEIYNKSKILVERSIFANIGTRLFETTGSGGFSLINRYPCQNGIDELGIDGKHFVTYDESLDDLMDKMKYYLDHDDEREKIAKEGCDHFINNHTYKHRIDKIIKDFTNG